MRIHLRANRQHKAWTRTASKKKELCRLGFVWLPTRKRQNYLPLRKRRGNHAVLGSSVSDRRPRRCRLGIRRDRWRIGWDRQDLVLHLSCPAFGVPGHPLHQRIPHTLRRISHGEKILTERV